MAGHTDNHVVIDAPLEIVWDRTNDVESWPHLFSEYEATEILDRWGDTTRFRLTLRPDEAGNRWSWVSDRTMDSGAHCTRSHRVEVGFFKYMHLFWEYVPAENGGTHLRWVQDFEMKAGAPLDDAAMTDRLNRNTAVQMSVIKERIEATVARER